jgi:RNA-binding protein YhbY
MNFINFIESFIACITFMLHDNKLVKIKVERKKSKSFKKTLMMQGILSEVEGSVQLTSSLR